jgi:hypothetical protein
VKLAETWRNVCAENQGEYQSSLIPFYIALFPWEQSLLLGVHLVDFSKEIFSLDVPFPYLKIHARFPFRRLSEDINKPTAAFKTYTAIILVNSLQSQAVSTEMILCRIDNSLMP